MPGINFGLLAPLQQQAQPLMGSAPSIPQLRQQDNLQDFSNGFLNAYNSGQQIQGNEQALELGEEKNKQAKLITKDMEQKAFDADQIRAAAAKGWDSYIEAQRQIDPVAAAKAETTMQEQQRAEAEAKSADSDQYNKSLDSRGKFYGIVNTGRNDEEKAQIWAIQRDSMPDSLKKLVPEKYDPQALHVGMSILTFAMADYKAKHPNDTKNPLQRSQEGRDEAKAALDAAKATGDKQKIDAAQQVYDEADKYVNKQATPVKMVNTPLDEQLGKQDAISAKEAADVRASMVNFGDTVKEAKTALEKTPALALGPVSSILDANNMSPEVQVLRHSLNALALQAKELYKLGSGQGFSNADRDFLTMIVGNPAQYKGSIKTILNQMEELSNRVQKQNYNREKNIRKGSNNYKQWLENNPDPSTIKPSDKPSQAPDHSAEDIQAEMKRRGLL